MLGVPSSDTLKSMGVSAVAQGSLIREAGRSVPAQQAGAPAKAAAEILCVDVLSPPHRDRILRLCRALASGGRLVRRTPLQPASCETSLV